METGLIDLKKALLILIGLQKVYQRKMQYLYEDSKVFLHQLNDPFKVKSEEQEIHIPG